MLEQNIHYIENEHDIRFIIIIIILLISIVLYIITKYALILRKETFDLILKPKKYTLAIMAIFKNEQDYMEEWLDHHIRQGFEQIYLYSNDHNLILYPYLLKYKHNVSIIDWTNKQNKGVDTIQRQAYTHCVQNYSNQTQFLLMLDIDEFIVPIEPYLKVCDFINELKPQWKLIKAFKIQRYNFGSNGHKTKPKGGVMTNYTSHEKICSSFKTLANTDFIDKKKNFYGVHDYNYIEVSFKPKIYNDYFGYHETGFPNSCKAESINEIPLVINHYYTKSYQEYLTRCELWKNGGINPINYRTDCKKKFKELKI